MKTLSILFILFFNIQNALIATDLFEIEDGFSPPKYQYNASFFSPSIEISFYGKYKNKYGYEKYSAFMAVTDKSFEGLDWIRYEDKYYYLSDGFVMYEFILDQLESFSNDGEKNYHCHYTETEKYDEVDVSALITSIKEADIISISFGAGLSHGYVPTLEESCSQLGLRKIPSSDQVTDDSIKRFLLDLVKSPQEHLPVIRDIWSQVDSCTVESTPAHLALENLINILKKDEKSILVYTDNIDGIHHRCGIELSRTKYQELEKDALCSYEQVFYPKPQDLEGKKITSLLIGQSFDFDCIHSHLFAAASQTNFFLLNVKGDPIKIFKNLDLSNIPEEGFDIKELEKINLPAFFVYGNVHNLIPQILEMYNSYE
jgi:hypothetical protein